MAWQNFCRDTLSTCSHNNTSLPPPNEGWGSGAPANFPCHITFSTNVQTPTRNPPVDLKQDSKKASLLCVRGVWGHFFVLWGRILTWPLVGWESVVQKNRVPAIVWSVRSRQLRTSAVTTIRAFHVIMSGCRVGVSPERHSRLTKVAWHPSDGRRESKLS